MRPTDSTRPFRSLRSSLVRLVKRLARRGDYLVAYARDTDRRVKEDPHAAVGGMWDVIGPLQFQYLKKYGLAPHHRMLDIGCGTLRGGRHFIKYLDPERYVGVDMSPAAIQFAHKLVADENLTEKRPRLEVSKGDLKFADFARETFDVLLAQSVFTHLPAENIDECFVHVGRVMKYTATFFFTFCEADEAVRHEWKGFHYPFSFFEDLARCHGFHVELMTDYDHPRSQRIVRMTKRAMV
jgi:SAM-dependent methyltransferase